MKVERRWGPVTPGPSLLRHSCSTSSAKPALVPRTHPRSFQSLSSPTAAPTGANPLSVSIPRFLIPVWLTNSSGWGQLDAHRNGCRDPAFETPSSRPGLPLSHSPWVQLLAFCCNHPRERKIGGKGDLPPRKAGTEGWWGETRFLPWSQTMAVQF